MPYGLVERTRHVMAEQVTKMLGDREWALETLDYERAHVLHVKRKGRKRLSVTAGPMGSREFMEAVSQAVELMKPRAPRPRAAALLNPRATGRYRIA